MLLFLRCIDGYKFLSFIIAVNIYLIFLDIELKKKNNTVYLIRYFCTPESFITNIPNQRFKYKITFVNSQLEITNSKGDFVLKTRV